MLRPIPISNLIGAFVNKMSRVIWDCIGIGLLHSVIGPENSRHSVNQSDVRLKPFMTWSLAFPALKAVCLFLLPVLIDSWGHLPFLLIGWLPHSIEKRYTYTILINFYSFLFSKVGFTTKDVVYKWVSTDSSEAVEKDPGLTTSEFDIGPIRIFESTTMYKTGKTLLKASNFYSLTSIINLLCT